MPTTNNNMQISPLLSPFLIQLHNSANDEKNAKRAWYKTGTVIKRYIKVIRTAFLLFKINVGINLIAHLTISVPHLFHENLPMNTYSLLLLF